MRPFRRRKKLYALHMCPHALWVAHLDTVGAPSTFSSLQDAARQAEYSSRLGTSHRVVHERTGRLIIAFDSPHAPCDVTATPGSGIIAVRQCAHAAPAASPTPEQQPKTPHREAT